MDSFHEVVLRIASTSQHKDITTNSHIRTIFLMGKKWSKEKNGKLTNWPPLVRAQSRFCHFLSPPLFARIVQTLLQSRADILNTKKTAITVWFLKSEVLATKKQQLRKWDFFTKKQQLRKLTRDNLVIRWLFVSKTVVSSIEKGSVQKLNT